MTMVLWACIAVIGVSLLATLPADGANQGCAQPSGTGGHDFLLA